MSVVSDSVRPHRWQPTRLPHPWDSPGKNTGVGCHLLLQCMKVKSESEVAQSCPTQRPHGLQPTRLLLPWDFPGKGTGVGCHCLLRKFMLLWLNFHIIGHHLYLSFYKFYFHIISLVLDEIYIKITLQICFPPTTQLSAVQSINNMSSRM